VRYVVMAVGTFGAEKKERRESVKRLNL